jgi:glutamate/tyrosine decarboxylase-like PLP-dependent enzyme
MSKEQFNTKLQLPREQMQKIGYKIVDMIVDHFVTLHNKPVTNKSTRSDLESRLREPLPEKGTEFDSILEKIQEHVVKNIMHVDHPRFFAFVPSPNNYISVIADTLISGFNIFSGTWMEGSGPAQIELVTIDWLRQLCGMPEKAGGLFVSGGSIANLTALAVARYIKLKNIIDHAMIYCSDQTHSSIDRAVKILGFNTSQLCKLPTGDNFRLDLVKLKQTIIDDRVNNKIPFCVIANAGTTNTGAIDPLDELAEICHKENMWFHADGAYGAATILTKGGKELLKGIEYVDSLTLDPHKWLFQPYEIGCILVKQQHWLRDTFHILPEYLKDVKRAKDEINFYDYGLQLTRSFRALKLWMSFKVFGLKNFRQAINKGIEHAEQLEQLIESMENWEIVTPAQIGVLTCRFAPKEFTFREINNINRLIVDKMTSNQFAMIHTTELKGKTVIRLCPINPRLSKADIEEFVHRLQIISKDTRIKSTNKPSDEILSQKKGFKP